MNTSNAHKSLSHIAAEDNAKRASSLAHRAAEALDYALTNSSAKAVQLDGTWYVLTQDTGEGQDYAYEPAAVLASLAHLDESTVAVGDRVEAGKVGTDDHDTGRVSVVRSDGCAFVSWDGSVTRTWHPCEDLRIVEKAPLDYSSWCTTIEYVTDHRAAVAHYVACGRILGDSASGILSKDEMTLLDIVRDLGESSS